MTEITPRILQLIDEQQILMLTIFHPSKNKQIKNWQTFLTQTNWSSIKDLRNYIKGVTLNLDSCQVDDENIQALLNQNQLMECIQYLYLGSNKLTQKGLQKILQKQRPNLIQLYLYGNSLGDTGIHNLLTKYPWLKIQNLNFGNNKFNYKCLYSIFQCSFLLNLKQLRLNSSNIGSNGIKILVKAKLQNLQELGLNECNIGKEGSKHLSKLFLNNLNKITLGWDNIIDQVQYLCLLSLPSLTHISLGYYSGMQFSWLATTSFGPSVHIDVSHQYSDFAYKCKNILYYRFKQFYKRKIQQ